MATLTWVLGRGGLLGSEIERQLVREMPQAARWSPPIPAFSWDEPARLARELDETARAFAQEVRARDASWMVLWCAGAGGVGTPAAALRDETRALQHLLGSLSVLQPSNGKHPPGLLLLSSSAGGVYSAGAELPLTEDSACSPISEYGWNKLRQEQQVRLWAEQTPRVRCLIARISNLYGPGALGARSEGLIVRLARHLVHRVPLNVYVPLDTLRDYLYVEDAARYILRCLRRLGEPDRPRSVVKLVASEQSISIAGVIGILARVAKRPPRIVCMPHALHRQQPERLRFRSRTWTDLAPPIRDLAAGVHAVYQRQLSLFQAGALPARSRD